MNYQGSPAIPGLRSIAPRIIVSRSGAVEPAFVHVTACATTWDSDADPARFHPYKDLEYSWDFGDPAGAEIFANPVAHMPGQPATVNANTDQTGPEACYVYRTPGTYKITLTARGRDQYGRFITATTTTCQVVARWFVNANWEWRSAVDGGTWTITAAVDGGTPQTTAPLAWNCMESDVLAALEALPNIGVGNVLKFSGRKSVLGPDMSCSGISTSSYKGLNTPLFCFVGALLGHDVVLTVANSLTRGGNPSSPTTDVKYQATRMLGQTGASVSGFTCQAFSGSTYYFDSAYREVGDGTRGRPYNTCAQLSALLYSPSYSVSNRRVLLKRGSVFDNGGVAWNFMRQGSGNASCIRVGSYCDPGHENDPRPVVRNGGAISDEVYQRSDVQTNHQDIVISDLDGFVFGASPSSNGSAGQEGGQLCFVYLDNCKATQLTSASRAVQWVCMTRRGGWHGLWGCDFRQTRGGAFNDLLTQQALGFTLLGCQFGGGGSSTDAGHSLYINTGGHNLVRWCVLPSHGPDGALAYRYYHVNLNGHDTATTEHGISRHHLFDACYFAGAKDGWDCSVASNDSHYGRLDLVIFQNCHNHRPGLAPGQSLTWTAFNTVRMVFRDCWFSRLGLSSTGAIPTLHYAPAYDPDFFHEVYRCTFTMGRPTDPAYAGMGRSAFEYGRGAGGVFAYNRVLKDSEVWPTNNWEPTIGYYRPGLAGWEVHHNTYWSRRPDYEFNHSDSVVVSDKLSLAQLQAAAIPCYGGTLEAGSTWRAFGFLDKGDSDTKVANLVEPCRQPRPLTRLGGHYLMLG